MALNPQNMSTPNPTTPTTIDLSAELVVILNPFDLCLSEFVGSRAMLEAEGIIPAGTKWPEAYSDLRWRDGEFDYWLKRKRPVVGKGPRSSFADCDWWVLRWELTNAPSVAEISIRLKQQALEKEIYRQSSAGQAEFSKRWNRYREATADERFQTFKALIPGIARPKRNRRPKKSESASWR